MVKQLFISHAWGNDGLDRDNHERCKLLYHKLVERKYSAWIDDNEMYGNIDSAIMKGINNAKAVIVCLTEKYCNKINNAVVYNLPNDNCYKEWNYSLFKQKIIIPVIMEPKMREIYIKQDGVVQMYFNSTLYIDASEDLDLAVNKICFTLKNNCIYNEKFTKKFNNIKKLDTLFTLLNFRTFKNNYNNKSFNNKSFNNKSFNNKSFNNTIDRDNEKIAEIYKKTLQNSKKEIHNELTEKSLPKYTLDNYTIFNNNVKNPSPLGKYSNSVLGTTNISGRTSPITKRSNSFSEKLSERLSPLSKRCGNLSPLSGLSNRVSVIEEDLQNNMKNSISNELKEDITKELKNDLTKEIKDIKRDIKRNLKKSISKNIEKNLLTGIIVNNTINQDESSEVNSDKDTTSVENSPVYLNKPVINSFSKKLLTT